MPSRAVGVSIYISLPLVVSYLRPSRSPASARRCSWRAGGWSVVRFVSKRSIWNWKSGDDREEVRERTSPEVP
jgi:hypothetical protein